MFRKLSFLFVFLLVFSCVSSSTTIILQNTTIDNLGDTYVYNVFHWSNYGGVYDLHLLGGSNTEISFFRFNISSIPLNANIEEASLNIRYYAEGIDTDEAYNTFPCIYNTSWSYNSLTWDDVDFSKFVLCGESSWLVEGSSPSPSPPSWINYSIVNILNYSYLKGDKNVSIVLNVTAVGEGASSGGDDIDFYSGNSVTPANRPYLNITYSVSNGGGAGTDTSGGHLSFTTGAGNGAGALSDLIFRTADLRASGTTAQSFTTKMTIKGSGNVGIGTITPSQKLDVDGSINISGTSGKLIFPDGTTLDSNSSIGSGSIDGTGTAGNLSYWTDADTLASSPVYLSSGKIGIGTTTPGNALEIATGILEISGPGEPGILIDRDNDWRIGTSWSGGWLPYNFYIKDVTAGTYPFVIERTSGNVGIGTTSPSKKFEVNGTAGAFNVNPDYSGGPALNTTEGNMTITSDGGSVIIKLG